MESVMQRKNRIWNWKHRWVKVEEDRQCRVHFWEITQVYQYEKEFLDREQAEQEDEEVEEDLEDGEKWVIVKNRRRRNADWSVVGSAMGFQRPIMRINGPSPDEEVVGEKQEVVEVSGSMEGQINRFDVTLMDEVHHLDQDATEKKKPDLPEIVPLISNRRLSIGASESLKCRRLSFITCNSPNKYFIALARKPDLRLLDFINSQVLQVIVLKIMKNEIQIQNGKVDLTLIKKLTCSKQVSNVLRINVN